MAVAEMSLDKKPTHLCQVVTGRGTGGGIEEQGLGMDSAQAFFKLCVLC